MEQSPLCPWALSAWSPPACGHRQQPCGARAPVRRGKLLPHRTREMLHGFLKLCNCPKQEFYRSPVDRELYEPAEILLWDSLMPAASWLLLFDYSPMRGMARFLFTVSIFTRLLQAKRLLTVFFFPHYVKIWWADSKPV